MISPENQIKEINIKRVIWHFLDYLDKAYPDIVQKIKSKIPNLLYLDSFTAHYSYIQHLKNNSESIMNTFKLYVTDDSQKNEIYDKFFIFYANKLKKPPTKKMISPNSPSLKFLPEDFHQKQNNTKNK